jgi:cytoskeletal protein RodZ
MPIAPDREPILVDPIDSLNLHAAPEPEPVHDEPVVRTPIIAAPSIQDEPVVARPEVRETPVPIRLSADERSYADESLNAEPHEALERSRPAVLPVAVVLIAGLLLGFMAGYFVGGRETIAPQASATPAAAPNQTSAPAPSASTPPVPSASSASAPAPSSAGPAAHAAATPPTVSEDSSPGPKSPEPSKPSTSAGHTPPPAPVATTGRIVVRSNPEKAGVMINGRWRGRTPLTLENMPFGKYTIKITQPGYKTEQSEVSLSARDTARSLNLRLAREAAPAARSGSNARPAAGTQQPAQNGGYTGTLFVDSRPQGAAVLLDGHLVGKTPLRLPDVRIGSHVVRLELAEHQAWTASTRVSAGQESRVTGSLERLQ